MALGRAGRGGPNERVARGLVPVAALLGFSAFMSLDPAGAFATMGVVTALSLAVWQGSARATRVAILSAAAGLGFLGGDVAAGVVVASAVSLGALYSRLERALPGEDDHYYLLPALAWVFLAVAAGAGLAFGGDAARSAYARYAQDLTDLLEEGGREFLRSSLAPGEEPTATLKWYAAHAVALGIGSLLATQAIASFLSIRWARARVGWSAPLRPGILLFRIGPRYSIVLAVALALSILAPDVKSVDLTSIALVLSIWFGSGCFLAGLACAGYSVVLLRLNRQPMAAGFYTTGTILLLVVVPIGVVVFTAIGLADIWFNLGNRPTPEGENARE